MIYCEITHISKPRRDDPHQRIQEVGGRFSDIVGPAIWRCTLDEAIRHQQEFGYSFHTRQGFLSSPVDVRLGPSGLLHMRTEADSTVQDNLLHLPELDSEVGARFVLGPIGSPIDPRGGIIRRAMK